MHNSIVIDVVFIVPIHSLGQMTNLIDDIYAQAHCSVSWHLSRPFRNPSGRSLGVILALHTVEIFIMLKLTYKNKQENKGIKLKLPRRIANH